MTRRLLAIDPSINMLGAAIYDLVSKKLLYYRLVRPEDRKGNEFDKSLSVYYQVRALRSEYKTMKTIMEIPVHWEKEGFAARESGSINKMHVVIGMIYTFGDVETVPPHGWKYQLPKMVIRRRLMKTYPNDVDMKLDHNVVDAIGIGHWYLHQRKRK